MTDIAPQPFIINHPQELGRLFWDGHVHSPCGKKWNISFCPGIVGSWKGFKRFMECSWDSLKWGWNPSQHADIIKFTWEFSTDIGHSGLDLITNIPKGISESGNNISQLAKDAPFGWLPRIVGNVVWGCFAYPIIKFAGGCLCMIIIAPGVFIITSVIACLGKFIIGNIGSLVTAISSIVPLIGGPIISAGISLGAIINRFPKPSDNGTYGLNIVENQLPSQ